MTAFRLTPARWFRSPVEAHLAKALLEHVRHVSGMRPSSAELKSWENSIPALAAELADVGLDDVEMLIEYQLPLTSRRADVILAGTHPDTGRDSYVVVELKQWSHAEPDEDDPALVLVPGAKGHRLHPIVQVRGYCQYIRDFLGIFEDGTATIEGVAYLHNASDLDVDGLYDLAPDTDGRLFTADRRGALLDYLRSRLSGSGAAGAGDRFLAGAKKPSKQLMALAAKEIKEREQFVLLDEQKIAYELVMRAVEKARRADTKEIVVVTGGPGSGKSVIALSLLGELNRKGYSALHATGSASFTETLRRIPGQGSKRVKSMFTYFNSYMQADKNGLDALICDEAHRIRRTSNNRFTPAARKSDRPQLGELVDAARVPVFLLDEHQVVKPDEIGTVEAIEACAAALGLPVNRVDLDDQYRCGGSRAYEIWVRRLLGLREGGPVRWDGDENFEVHIARTPHQVEEMLNGHKAEGSSARLSAGFCWPWSKPRDDRTLVPDVVIGDWSRPWNVKGDRAVGDAPPRTLWATHPNGFGQVGCVYTAQGFEYDWNGVILGPDIVVRDGRLVTVREANRDPAYRSCKTVTDDQYDRHIRNIYLVLLTRGMRGTIIYAVDEETREFLRKLVEG